MFRAEPLPREQVAAHLTQVAREPFQPHLGGMHGGFCGVVQLQGRVVEPAFGLRHPFDKPSGYGRRGFERRVGHHVGHAGVLVVPDARHHRQRELRHVGAEPVGVETVEVAGRAAAADEDHGVEFVHPLRDGAQRRDDRLLGRRALHEGVEERHLETVGAFGQLLAEILIAGGVGARYDRHALHHDGHRCFAVHVPDALFLKLGDGHLPLPLHVAQRVGGVDVGDLERESVEFVVIDGDLGQNLDSGGEPLAGFGFEVSCDAGVGRAPDHGARLGQRNAVVALFFDQFEVAVA